MKFVVSDWKCEFPYIIYCHFIVLFVSNTLFSQVAIESITKTGNLITVSDDIIGFSGHYLYGFAGYHERRSSPANA